MPFADVAALAQPPHAVVVPVAATPWKTVTVRPGDTIWQLALEHRTTVDAIVERNRLPRGGSLIHPGQKVVVPNTVAGPTAKAPRTLSPKRTTRAPAKAAVTTYTIKSGDTLSVIAQRYGITLDALLAANPGINPRGLQVGQKITVPVKTSTTPAPSQTPPGGYTYPSKTAQEVAASKARLAAMSVPSRTETAAMIRATATRHGVDPRLALAVGWIESGWYQRAVSYSNAVGVMQIMPIAETWAGQLAGRRIDRYQTQDNITAGVLILRALQASADSREQAIAAYYQGLYSVRTKGLYEDTKKYVANVLAVYDRM